MIVLVASVPIISGALHLQSPTQFLLNIPFFPLGISYIRYLSPSCEVTRFAPGLNSLLPVHLLPAFCSRSAGWLAMTYMYLGDVIQFLAMKTIRFSKAKQISSIFSFKAITIILPVRIARTLRSLCFVNFVQICWRASTSFFASKSLTCLAEAHGVGL